MHSLMVPNFVPLWNFKDYIIPDTIKNSIMLERFKKAVETNMKVMEEFRNSGVVEEDLVYFYLGAQMCNVITTMNARSLLHFFELRCCNRAQWEIREMAWKMLAECRKAAPALFKDAGPACLTGRCPEGKASCGKAKEVKERHDSL
jgi:thymidylate synthase (FAD)